MSNIRSSTLSPGDLARVALKRLTELGLPPTPDNYAKFYNAIATIKSPSDKSNEELKSAYQVLFRVSDLLDGVSDTTEALLADLQRGGENMSQSLEALRAAEDGPDVQTLLAEIIDSTGSVCETVVASHRDLQQLKTAMNKIQSDVAINRKTLEQDPLTGALNRPGLEHALNKEVKRARRAQSPFSVAILDLHGHRQLTEQYGHLVGDRILLHFTNIAKAALRESDQLVRYGQEEFLLMLPETDVNGASYMVDRLKQVNLKTPFLYQQHRLDVHFCTGIAQLQQEENGHGMMLRADEAMRRAKTHGRDHVVLAD